MDPLTAVAIGSTVAGAATSALGAQQKGQADASMYTYQAGVARMNEQIAKQNADWTLNAGEIEAQQSGMKTRFQIGRTKAIQSGSGIRVDSGSSEMVRTSELAVGQEDQALIRSNAAHKAYGFMTEAAGEEAQANLYDFAAKKSKTAGTINLISSILGGASSVSSKWLQGKGIGLFGSSGGGTQQWSYAEGDE